MFILASSLTVRLSWFTSYDDLPAHPSATRPAIRQSSTRDAWCLSRLKSLVGGPRGILRDDCKTVRSRGDAAHHHHVVQHHEHHDHDARHDNDDRDHVRADHDEFYADDNNDNADHHHHGARHDNDDRAHLLHVALRCAGVQLR